MGEHTKRILSAVACLIMGCAVGVVVTYCATTGALNQNAVSTEALQQGTEKYLEIMNLVDNYLLARMWI